MKITREQFIRGFNAVRASFERQHLMNEAAKTAGIEDYDHGQDPVAYELQRQLEERCDELVVGKVVGTAISYGLCEGHIVTPGAGMESFRMNTAEAVWRWWEETKTGPFRSATLPRYDISAYPDAGGAGWDADASSVGDWVKFADVEALLAGEGVRS